MNHRQAVPYYSVEKCRALLDKYLSNKIMSSKGISGKPQFY